MWRIGKLNRRNQAVRRTGVRYRGRTVFSVMMLGLMGLAVLVGVRLFLGADEERRVIRMAQPAAEVAPLMNVMVKPEGEQGGGAGKAPARYLVGIVAGHRGYDPGAVCEDGLTEAEVNYAVAVEVVALLERRGVRADLLEEYDERLTDYEADALVSIHADSCNIPGASGFKVARVTNSAIPEAEDQLVACLSQEYGVYTGLAPHPASITDNMRNYHAFNEIAPLTPGAIIETGFLLEDGHLLRYKPKVVARGIAAGVLCFLEK